MDAATPPNQPLPERMSAGYDAGMDATPLLSHLMRAVQAADEKPRLPAGPSGRPPPVGVAEMPPRPKNSAAAIARRRALAALNGEATGSLTT